VFALALPGFVRLGLVVVAAQVVLVGGCWAYLRWRADGGRDRRAAGLVGVGTLVAVGGQLLAFGALGSLWTGSALSLGTTLDVVNAGAVGALVGILLVLAGFGLSLRGRAGTGHAGP
jgi:hypothetical protein